MKYYDKSMYQTEQHVRIIVTILIAFVNTKTEDKNQVVNVVQENSTNK